MSAARRLEIPTHRREEFYELEHASSTRHDFYAGRIVEVAANTPIHARIVGSAVSVLGNALVPRPYFAVPCLQMVRIEATDMDVYPDVVVYNEGTAIDPSFPDTLTEPLVLAEVLSPSTKNVDLTTKLEAYFKIPTLTDYLVVWQDEVRLDQFVRTQDETPKRIHHLNRNSRIRLEALDIEFALGDLYRLMDDLPEGAL